MVSNFNQLMMSQSYWLNVWPTLTKEVCRQGVKASGDACTEQCPIAPRVPKRHTRIHPSEEANRSFDPLPWQAPRSLMLWNVNKPKGKKSMENLSMAAVRVLLTRKKHPRLYCMNSQSDSEYNMQATLYSALRHTGGFKCGKVEEWSIHCKPEQVQST